MTDRKVYELCSLLLEAQENCRESGNTEWMQKHGERLAEIVSEYMPSGSGWDTGTRLDKASTPERIIFHGSFHHMDENGSYDGWTDHTITARPSLGHGFTLTISGRDRNGIKDHLYETFSLALSEIVTEKR